MHLLKLSTLSFCRAENSIRKSRVVCKRRLEDRYVGQGTVRRNRIGAREYSTSLENVSKEILRSHQLLQNGRVTEFTVMESLQLSSISLYLLASLWLRLYVHQSELAMQTWSFSDLVNRNVILFRHEPHWPVYIDISPFRQPYLEWPRWPPSLGAFQSMA